MRIVVRQSQAKRHRSAGRDLRVVVRGALGARLRWIHGFALTVN